MLKVRFFHFNNFIILLNNRKTIKIGGKCQRIYGGSSKIGYVIWIINQSASHSHINTAYEHAPMVQA